MNNPYEYPVANEGPLIPDTPEIPLDGDIQCYRPEDCASASAESNTLHVPEEPTADTVAAVDRGVRVSRVSKSHISPDAIKTARKADRVSPPRERRRAAPTAGQRRARRGVNNAKAPGKPPFTSNPRLARQIANLQQDK